MPAVFLVRDRDPERRRNGVRAAQSILRRFDLEMGSAESGPVALVWAAFAGAPVSASSGAFVLGDVIPGPGPERLEAADYATRLAGRGVPPAFDGFHVAATFDAQGAFTVAVDILGMYALYHAAFGEVVLVASSPELITAYPGFPRAIDPLGLAALLIANAGTRGRTPYRGIRRLPPGDCLVADPASPPREVRQYAIELNRASHDVPAEECVARVHEALVDAAKRHVPTDEPHTMLLSGGLDSRLLVGVLARQGVAMNAITRGAPTDLDYRCARAVTRRLRMAHHRVPHADATFEAFERLLRWDGLACAPGGPGGELGEVLPHAHPHLVAGYMADPILGGVTITKSFDREARAQSAEHFVRRLNVWGVPLDLLPRLLRKEVFADAVPVVLAELHEDYAATADTELGRAWILAMHLRGRFAMGGMWARMAFGGWPRIPQADRALLQVVGGVPLPLLGGRWIEMAMLKRFHADLARLPLDRNDPDITPPLPGVMDLVRAGVDRRIRRVRQQLGIPRPDRRYYHRTFDFNGSGWRMVRRHAESDRERAYALFDRAAFDAIVPRPDQPWRSSGTIEGASSAKMLVSLGVWMRVALG